MTPEQAAALVPQYVAEAQSRIKGDEAVREYASAAGQRFERQSLTSLADYARDELLDQINYAVFTLYRLDQLRGALDKLGPILGAVDANNAAAIARVIASPGGDA